MRPNQLAYWTWCKKEKNRPTNIEDQYINFLKIRAQLGSQRYVPWRTQLWIMDEPNSIFVGQLLSRSFYLIGSNSHSPQNFLLHMVHSPKILHLEQKAKKHSSSSSLKMHNFLILLECLYVEKSFQHHPYDAVLNLWKTFLLPPLFHSKVVILVSSPTLTNLKRPLD